jgi:CubicO group peptidase (beta-lactamase class C family)
MRMILAAVVLAVNVGVQGQLPPGTEAQLTVATEKVLEDSGVPSASVGIVKDGRIVYMHGFGLARVQPPLQATAAMAYPIGSISKQFTATAVLMLEQEGKLSLSDPVEKYFPELTRSGEVTILNLLTHTSGYQDYAPQDYTIPAWRLPVDPIKVVREYAGKPLDFDPGTQWQYSNTNFVLLALIVEKVSGEPFAKFLRERVLGPAGLEHVLNLNTEQAKLEVTGYMRNALAPIRPAVLEAPGWYFGDGDLAMPVSDLLKWDLTILNRSVLSAASYKLMETPFILKDGKNTDYGLGMDVGMRKGRRAFWHGGEVGGYVAENAVYPDDDVAIAVETNQEASNAASEIESAIAALMLPPATVIAAETDSFAAKLEAVLAGLERGRIDRSLFTANCNSYFDKDALEDFRSSLSPLGAIASVKRVSTSLRGGMTFVEYRATFSDATALLITVYLMPDGRIEQLLVIGKG